jgi:pimeloyl-ACP methyl ester carboxylesterase
MLLGRDDRLLPPAVQKWAAQLPGTARVVDGDHFLCLTQPELVAEQIRTLFDGN